jgi:hypothetical protein
VGENPHWEVLMFRNVKVCASLVVPCLTGIMATPAAYAAEPKETYKVVHIVPLPAGSKSNPTNPLVSADIAWVDADSHVYALTDRSNRSIDIIDTRKNEKIRFLRTPANLTAPISG